MTVSPYMARALALAREQAGRTSPGASVGAVVVKDGQVAGEGSYQGIGSSHAEAAAIAAAGEAARGATLYVTLEPCCHHGHTPPCTDAIVRAGIAEVHLSHVDPDARVSGRGSAALETAGIRVVAGEGEAEARRINEAYLKQRSTGRPFVIAKFAASLDGKIAATSGDSRWVSGPGTLAWSHELRTRIDAIAAGVNTVLVDDPQLTARPGDQLAARQPLRVVLDSRGRAPPEAKVLTSENRPLVVAMEDISPDVRGELEASGARVELLSTDRGRVSLQTAADLLKAQNTRGTCKTLIATTEASDAAWRARMEAAGAQVAVLPADASGRVGLPALLELLGAADVLSLLVEGGGVLLGSFFDERLVDKVHAVIAPMIIGGASAPAAVAGVGAARMADALRLQDVTVERLGDDVLVTGYTAPQ